MSKFICTTDFELSVIGDDGLPTEDNMTVKESSIWVDDYLENYIGGFIHLENNTGQWIEIDEDTFREYFKEISDGKADELLINPEVVKRWQEQGLWQCEKCGCTENEACEDGCHWIRKNLCSNCVGGEVSDETK